MEKAITILRGKEIREMAQRLTAGSFRIEKETLNRYAVFEGTETPDQTPIMYVNRTVFVRLDSEIYKIQARQNKLAFAIERALDADSLEFCIDKASVDKMQFKLIARTLSTEKVVLDKVTLNSTGNNYLLTIALVPSVSERALTERETEIAAMFKRAAAASNPETETPALPAPETVETTARTVETIPAK